MLGGPKTMAPAVAGEGHSSGQAPCHGVRGTVRSRSDYFASDWVTLARPSLPSMVVTPASQLFSTAGFFFR